MQQRLYAFISRIKVHQAYDLIVVCADLMYLSCEFRELAVILHGRLVHRYHFETLSKNTSAHKIRLGLRP